MADSEELKPIEFRQFKNECDADYVDAEDLNLQYLKETLNLTPFRQLGSLIQCDGTSIKIAQADMPNPVDFVPVMHKWISFNKDNQEILLVVYEKPSTGQTKYYINKYYNPVAYGVSQNNNIPSQPVGWVDGWLELTEKYSTRIDSVGALNTVVLTTDLGLDDDYLNSFFIVNKNVYRDNRYNYITDWVKSTKTLTLKGNIAGGGVTNDWTAADDLVIVRFPVTWLYNQNIDSIDEEEEIFDGKPTDFIYIDNALRIPCGKYRQPLILTFVDKRSYFLGDMQYDGLWFDFQQLPQVSKNSAVSFVNISGGSSTVKYLNKNGSNWEWGNSAGADASVKFEFLTGNTNTVIFKEFTGTSPVYPDPSPYVFFEWKQIHTDIWTQKPLFGFFGTQFIRYWVKRGSTFSASQIASRTHLPPWQPYPFTVTEANAGNFPAVPANLNIQNLFTNTWTASNEEFGKNATALNKFIGASLTVTPAASNATWIGIERYKFIMNVVYDNRSELRLAHGTHRPKGTGDTSTATGTGLQLYFNLWFSRRLTGLNFFNQKHDKFAADFSAGSYPAIGKELMDYPYFQYVDGEVNSVRVRSEETKHFARYSLADFQRVDKGSIAPFRMRTNVFDVANGTNAFTYDANNARWYIVCNDTNCGWGADGEGLSHVAKTKRFLTQDITMNYEKGVFIGDTNGRLFVINATNTIENELLDNSDNTYFSLYAGLVSQYDVMLRNKHLSIASKDGDRIKRINNNRGTILYIKDKNVYALNTRVSDDTKYYIADTYLGRGGYSSYDTPHGTVMLSDDNVWIISDDTMEPLMTPTNGKLKLYRETIALYKDQAFIEYNTTKDELYVFMNYIIFIYSFDYKAWTRSEMVQDAVVKYTGVNKAREITFINQVGSNYNITKMDESSVNWIDSEGNPFIIFWLLSSHQLPLAGREQDFNPQFITINYSATCSANTDGLGVIVNTTDANGVSSKLEKLRSGINLREELPLLPLPDCSEAQIALSNNISTSTININSIILWISTTKRKLGAYQK